MGRRVRDDRPPIEGFLGDVGRDDVSEPDRAVATVLFVDIVGSTQKAVEIGDSGWQELLKQFRALIRRQLVRYRGRELDTAGDGVFASFDGPARAIRCACSVSDETRALGVEVRVGLHTGECEFIDGKLGGIVVHIGARIAVEAEPGEVLVSSTVKDLVAGSDKSSSANASGHAQRYPGSTAAVRRRPASRIAHGVPAA